MVENVGMIVFLILLNVGVQNRDIEKLGKQTKDTFNNETVILMYICVFSRLPSALWVFRNAGFSGTIQCHNFV